jgi:predicted kinase
MTAPAVGRPDRRVVLVSGPPGSGKSSLAVPLAEALGYALLSKDLVKETLWDALRPLDPSRTWSHRIGGSAMEVLWALASRSPRVVLEANFRPRSDYERWRLEGLDARIVEVYCTCPLDVAQARFRQRARRPDHHPAHVDRAVTPEFLAEFDRPFGQWPVITVDTTQPVDVEALRAKVIGVLAGPGTGSNAGESQEPADELATATGPDDDDLKAWTNGFLQDAGRNAAPRAAGGLP